MKSTLRLAARGAALALALSCGVAAPASAQAFIGAALGGLITAPPPALTTPAFPAANALTAVLAVAATPVAATPAAATPAAAAPAR